MLKYFGTVSVRTSGRMTKHRNVVCILWPLIVAPLFIGPSVGLAQDEVITPVSVEPPGDLVWKDVGVDSRVQILDLLSGQIRANLEKIKTWTVDCLVHSEVYLSPVYVKNTFRERLPKESTPALIQESLSRFKIAIKMDSGAIYREQDTKRFRLLTTDTRRSIVIPGVAAIDNRSIVTPREYVYFTAKFPPMTFAVLPDHPEASQKRAAHREPPENARNLESAELLDPRYFFHCSTSGSSWAELEMYANFLSGKKGAEMQRDLSGRLRITQAVDDHSKTWYRIQLQIRFADGTVNVVTSVWSPLAGFNPVSLTFIEEVGGAEIVRRSVKWLWEKKSEDIFVPTYMSEVSHPKDPGDIDTFKRIVEVKEFALNKPLATSQFEYSALGLGNGDLILDEIEKAVFVMRDGLPRRLAAYNEPYVPNRLSVRERVWSWLIVANCSLIVLILALFLRRRFRSTSA